MNYIKLALLCAPLLFCTQLSAQNLEFDKDIFEKWVNVRAGNGKKAVLWYCFGEVYAYPEGKLVAKMQGVDLATQIPVTEDSVIQLNRKLFLYLDKDKETILDSLNGMPVTHIKYPYQVIEYVHKGNELVTYVTQGSGARLARLGPTSTAKVKKVGNNLVFSFPAFMNFQTAKGKYEAYENFDFFYNPNASKTVQKFQLTWWRYGELPPFLGSGKSVIQLVSHRVGDFEDLPEQLKTYIRTNASLWLEPPLSLEEIHRIQSNQ
ncbi:MAG: DUF1838 family protein [Saprospiraceae bacterium]|nr:DUF1838 family protein [Saprospiraceae bacterium]